MSSCNLMQYVPQQTSHIVHLNGCGYIVKMKPQSSTHTCVLNPHVKKNHIFLYFHFIGEDLFNCFNYSES